MDIVDALITSILRGSFYSLMAVGLSLVFGVINIANFAHGEFYMLGAFVSYFAFMILGLNPILSVLAAGVFAFIFGALIEKILFVPLRKRSQKNWLMNTFLLTLGLSIIMQQSMRLIAGSKNYGIKQGYFKGSFQIFGMSVANDRIFAFAVSIISIIALMYFLNYTRIGKAIRAVSQDSTGAKLVGVNLSFIYTLTFGLSCSLAAIAGACLLSIIPANPLMGISSLNKSWFVLILVGMGNVEAGIIGGLIVGFLETVAINIFSAGWMDLISLGIIIIILLVKPNGLFGKKGVKSVVE